MIQGLESISEVATYAGLMGGILLLWLGYHVHGLRVVGVGLVVIFAFYCVVELLYVRSPWLTPALYSALRKVPGRWLLALLPWLTLGDMLRYRRQQ